MPLLFRPCRMYFSRLVCYNNLKILSNVRLAAERKSL